MTFSIGVVGAGQFGSQFAHLFNLHPGVSAVHVVDELPERAAEAVDRYGLAGSQASFEELLASDVDAVAIFTQRWTHGPLVEQASVPASTCTRPSRWLFPRTRLPASSRLSVTPGWST
jgi:predicted dehydrogenase